MPLCGGNWNNGAADGAFAVNLNNLRSNSNANVGFRSALPSKSDTGNLRVFSQYRGVKDPISALSSEKQGTCNTGPFGHGMPIVEIIEIRNAPKINKLEGIMCL